MCSVRYGTLNRVEIKRNYAFVEFKELADSIDAQKRCHGREMDGRTITVEFVDSSRQKREDRCAAVVPMPDIDAKLGSSSSSTTWQ